MYLELLGLFEELEALEFASRVAESRFGWGRFSLVCWFRFGFDATIIGCFWTKMKDGIVTRRWEGKGLCCVVMAALGRALLLHPLFRQVPTKGRWSQGVRRSCDSGLGDLPSRNRWRGVCDCFVIFGQVV